jgi:HlyD family secretion protein
MRRPPILALVSALGLAACNSGNGPDAYGNFEADDVVISAQVAGPILRFDALEGEPVAAGAVLAIVDTQPLAIERRQLQAQRGVVLARRQETAAQLASTLAQLEIAERAQQRVQRLRDGDAATAQQSDAAERDVRVLSSQRDALQAGSASLTAELASLDARIAGVDDRLARAEVRAPLTGTILTTFARVGETVQPGQPLISVADLSTLTLRAYLTGNQLGQVRLGQSVTVHATIGDSLVAFPGTVAWISARAEFTPTPIQTRNERADLVYAMKVRVADPQGRLKIGMPGDVNWTAAP